MPLATEKRYRLAAACGAHKHTQKERHSHTIRAKPARRMQEERALIDLEDTLQRESEMGERESKMGYRIIENERE